MWTTLPGALVSSWSRVRSQRRVVRFHGDNRVGYRVTIGNQAHLLNVSSLEVAEEFASSRGLGDSRCTWRREAESAEPKSARKERYAAQSWESLIVSSNPVCETAREFADVFPNKIPAELPSHHKKDLVPGSKYCATRQWPLPRVQVKAIGDFF
ncbi:hypothetical protein PF005_g8976 [Phytophthora fragariae]|uniref:Uncharacterized protein n=1 Tax=Phytophthora fragariae TaxID=53985 RepID=A0A6A4DN84_9STRA|nr:hypothetical protein PF003_g3056 [Phytophthora fragariae]KAE9014846.1 hypothetical protein PF011_g7882 [Phytophthora fragariae]KAE9111117.1 hypothetical protein PF010_g10930 [Phytophthora fragariae]KAE9112112.1 hypothetical protein PF007_g11222 [Phytophthora fragariae]KAE9135074.1 hypothetical protein PF006_g14687 [Phytophthora fragariae]